MPEIKHAVLHSWADTKGMLPLLFLLFLALEFFQHRHGEKLGVLLRRAGMLGPLIGAALGIVPQCGFSVVASLLYLQGYITPGTLLAVFLATSDEAVPVMLAQPDKLGFVAPLLVVKLILGISGGYFTDLILLPRRLDFALPGWTPGHTTGDHAHPELPGEIIHHASLQTAQIYTFAFVATAALIYGTERLGFDSMAKLLLAGSPWQIPLAAVIGLVPNCVVSVVITQLYLEGALSFGATVAGLASTAGLGLLVLFRHNRSWLDTVRLVGLLLGFALIAGVILSV
ncbi:MAG: putative manganese transporter [bacterium]|jgi:hypothetical protein